MTTTRRMQRWSCCCCGSAVLAALLVALVTKPVAAIAEDAMLNQCSELKAQEHLDLKEVMGKWYVVEVIEHKSEPRPGSSSSSGGMATPTRVLVDACPIIKLRALEGRASKPNEGPPRMSLMWEEYAGTLEYKFWVSSNRGPGVWNCDIIQNGTLADKPSYKQFVGTVHVMKAVASHMVLTFCARNTEGQKFSVLVGREHKLPKTDLRGVHKLLERRNLQLFSIRESCANGAATGFASTHLDLGLVAFGLVATLAWHFFN